MAQATKTKSPALTHLANMAQAFKASKETAKAIDAAKAPAANVELKGPNKTPSNRTTKQQGNVHIIGNKLIVKTKAEQKAAKQAQQSSGEQLAIEAFEKAIVEDLGWKEHFDEVRQLTVDGVKAYRLALLNTRDTLREAGDLTKSAEVKISECMALAKALEAGFDDESAVKLYAKIEPTKAPINALMDLTHANIIKTARAFTDAKAQAAHAEAGTEAPKKQGRPAKTPVQKFEAYMLANIEPKYWAECAAQLAKMIKAQKA